MLPSSGEPEELRASLRHALPRAPAPSKQAIQEPAMLHTTIARLLAPARRPAAGARQGGGPGEEVAAGVLTAELTGVAVALTDELCGLEALFDELW